MWGIFVTFNIIVSSTCKNIWTIQFKTYTWIKTKPEMCWYAANIPIVQIPRTSLNEDNVFDEVSYVLNYVNNDALKGWEEMKYHTEQRWRCLKIYKKRNFIKKLLGIVNTYFAYKERTCLPKDAYDKIHYGHLRKLLWHSKQKPWTR